MLFVIAVLFMVIDHIGLLLFPEIIFFRVIGRLAFPIFAYNLVDGYTKTKDINKYMKRLLYIALVSQIPYILLFGTLKLNICFTFYFSLMLLRLIDNTCLNKYVKYLFIFLFSCIAQLLMSYGAFAIITIVMIYRNKRYDYFILNYFILNLIFSYINGWAIYQVVSVLAFYLMKFLYRYNFCVNRIVKYSLYPAHLIILYFIKLFL